MSIYEDFSAEPEMPEELLEAARSILVAQRRNLGLQEVISGDELSDPNHANYLSSISSAPDSPISLETNDAATNYPTRTLRRIGERDYEQQTGIIANSHAGNNKSQQPIDTYKVDENLIDWQLKNPEEYLGWCTRIIEALDPICPSLVIDQKFNRLYDDLEAQNNTPLKDAVIAALYQATSKNESYRTEFYKEISNLEDTLSPANAKRNLQPLAPSQPLMSSVTKPPQQSPETAPTVFSEEQPVETPMQWLLDYLSPDDKAISLDKEGLFSSNYNKSASCIFIIAHYHSAVRNDCPELTTKNIRQLVETTLKDNFQTLLMDETFIDFWKCYKADPSEFMKSYAKKEESILSHIASSQTAREFFEEHLSYPTKNTEVNLLCHQKKI